MGTVGRPIPPGSGGNYRLDNRKSRIEAATNFAFKGSVFNELVHTLFAVPGSYAIANNIIDGRFDITSVGNSAVVGFNLALVALQRYNRARMIKRIDEELLSGATYLPDYKNYLGIDARAVENYESKLKPQQLDQSSSETNINPAYQLAPPSDPYLDALALFTKQLML
jgi:hypothetical protein